MLICAGLGEERLLTRTPGWKKGKEVCLLPAGIKRPRSYGSPPNTVSLVERKLYCKEVRTP